MKRIVRYLWKALENIVLVTLLWLLANFVIGEITYDISTNPYHVMYAVVVFNILLCLIDYDYVSDKIEDFLE